MLSSDHATVGGMDGNNSRGTHSLMAGKTVDDVEAFDVLTYAGDRLRIGRDGTERGAVEPRSLTAIRG